MQMKTKSLTVPLQLAKLSTDEVDAGIWKVEGYATIWGNQNAYDFSIAKGAYLSLIAEGVTPKMFFNHSAQDVPIGKWVELSEDDVGLKVVGQFTQGVTKAKDVYLALKDGTVDGLSVGIGFYADDVEEKDDGTFEVLKVSALPEISVCSFPADGKARVTKTLSTDELDERISQIETLRDIEALLRELGLSKRQSGWLVSQAKTAIASVNRSDSEQEELKALGATLDALASQFQT